jgi:hypothetical protein
MSKKSDLGQLYLLTLLSPIATTFVLLKTKDSRMLIAAGTLLFTIVGSLFIYVPGNDGFDHLQTVRNNYLDMSLVTFFTDLVGLLTFSRSSSGLTDPYLHILAYISGGILRMPGLLHLFTSFIYGAIYFRAISFVLNGVKIAQFKIAIYLIITVFLVYRGVTGLNSIRWWTAFWALFLGVVGFAKTKERKYILIALSSMFIHFSFLLFTSTIFFAYFFRRFQKLILMFWIASFFLGTGYDFVKPLLPEIEAVSNREKYLLDEDILAKSAAAKGPSKKNFYAEYGESFMKDYSIVILAALLFYLNFLNPKGDDVFLTLFTAGVALHSLGNLLAFSPSVSGRGQAAASVFILAAGIRYFGFVLTQNQRIYSKQFVRFATVVISIFFVISIPVILFQIAYSLEIFSAFLLFFPPVSWFLADNDISLREFIGLII